MKKNKVLLCGVILGTIVATGFATTTYAEESITSNATIKAIAGEEAVDPVDPTDPTNPDKPGDTGGNDGNNTHQNGSLQINYLSNLNFGDNIAITGRKVTATVKNKTPRFFQVSDLRGTSGGWTLNVSLGNFNPTSTKVTNKPIKGAEIKFSNGEAKTSSLEVESSEEPIVNDTTLEVGKEPKPLMKASKGTGRGTWLATYTAKSDPADNENIVFEAPTNSISANTNYKAILTWQLVDGV